MCLRINMKKFIIGLLLVISSVKCNPCSRLESIDITNAEVLANNSVIYNEVEFLQSSWYEIEENGEKLRLGCPCIGRTCLWKCCNPGEMFFNRNCTSSDFPEVNPFSPSLYKGREPVNTVASSHFFYMFNNRLCEDRYIVDTLLTSEELFIQENGTLMEVAANRPQWHLPMTYCVDIRSTDSATQPRLMALVCYPEEAPATEDSPVLHIVYAVGLILSVPFLLATFLVYAMIAELRNLHGMCLMAYCAGLIVAYPLLAYLKLNVGPMIVSEGVCLTFAFIIYYAFQTSFFWLNVMCFDIWRTFSGYRSGGSNKKREQRRFMLYGIYAWGVPVALTAVTIGMQFGTLPPHVITPGFGDRRCWFVEWLAELVYFFTPVLALVVCNVVLFSVTAHRIRSIRQETAILKGAESSRSDKLQKDKQRYALYLKLFVVMGVNWTVEVISFAAGGSNWYWIVVDLSNIGLGVFIFFIFVWKNKVRNLVRKKFVKWRSGAGDGRTTFSDSSNGRWATRSSSAPTEVTRVSADDAAIRLKDMR